MAKGNGNKWQHTVPVGYLVRWAACVNERRPRASHVWRYDGKKSHRVPCGSVCAEDQAYSSDTQREHSEHGPPDASLPAVIRAALAGEIAASVDADRNTANPAASFGFRLSFFGSIAHLHARNPAFELVGYPDRLTAVTPTWRLLVETLLGFRADHVTDPILRMALFQSAFLHWNMTILRDPHKRLWTSEHPSLVLAENAGAAESGPLELWCPIAPDACVRFAPNSARACQPELSREQIGILNRTQVVSSPRAVFSFAALDEGERRQFADGQALRTGTPRRAITRGKWGTAPRLVDLVVFPSPPL